MKSTTDFALSKFWNVTLEMKGSIARAQTMEARGHHQLETFLTQSREWYADLNEGGSSR